jgi:hypothetical protein
MRTRQPDFGSGSAVTGSEPPYNKTTLPPKGSYSSFYFKKTLLVRRRASSGGQFVELVPRVNREGPRGWLERGLQPLIFVLADGAELIPEPIASLGHDLMSDLIGIDSRRKSYQRLVQGAADILQPRIIVTAPANRQ